MTKMTEHILHCTLAQSHPHGKRQVGGVNLLVTSFMEELAAGAVLARVTPDPFQADGGEQACPHCGVVVGYVNLAPRLCVPSVALLLHLLPTPLLFL